MLIDQAVRETGDQDKSIQGLATTLRDMLSTTKAIPNLEVIPGTTNVIEEIIRQSIETAVLIGEYTKLDFGGNSVPRCFHDPAESNDALFVVRTARIQTDLKDCIEKCQKTWDELEKKLSLRINVDTNIQVRGIKDSEKGVAELVFFSMINDNNSFNSPSGEDS